MADKTKSVGGDQVPMSKFAYVGDSEDLETWKLPIHDASHVRNALARYNQTDLPEGAKEGVWRKIIAAAKKFGIEVSDKSTDVGAQGLAPGVGAQGLVPLPQIVNLFSRGLRMVLGAAVVRDGKELYEAVICVTGSWVKNDRHFTISAKDLADMVKNFEKRKNEQVVVDYEHASEMPEVARGGPVPAAGWIHTLIQDGADLVGAQGLAPLPPGGALKALIEWTPQAQEMIRSAQYRFFSPAIDFGHKDKETGEDQGATLTSGALTNHPFLEELPAVTLTDQDTGKMPVLRSTAILAVKGGKVAKKLTAKKLDDGSIGFMDGDDLVGMMDYDDFMDLAGKYGKKMQEEACEAARATLFGEVGAQGLAPLQVKHFIELGRAAEADQARIAARTVLLAEAVGTRHGVSILDSEKAKTLLRAGKINGDDLLDAIDTAELIEGAVRDGRLLPKDRAVAFKIALSSADYRDFLKAAPRVIAFETLGATRPAEAGTADEEVFAKVREAQEKNPKLTYAEAFTKVLGSDPGLAARYHSEHRVMMGSKGPSVVA